MFSGSPLGVVDSFPTQTIREQRGGGGEVGGGLAIVRWFFFFSSTVSEYKKGCVVARANKRLAEHVMLLSQQSQERQ